MMLLALCAFAIDDDPMPTVFFHEPAYTLHGLAPSKQKIVDVITEVH